MEIDKDNFFWKAQAGELPLPATVKTLGIKFSKVDSDNMSAQMEFEGKPEFTNPSGNIQGGFLAAMLDDVMAVALSAILPKGEYAPTVNMNIQFHRPGRIGPFTGYGKVDKIGRKICYLSGSLEQNGKVVITATASALRTKLDLTKS